MSQGASDVDAFLQELGVDAAEIAERQAFLEFTDADVVLLVDLHNRIERAGECDFFLEAFYAHLQAFEGTRALLRDEETLKRVKQTQSEYFHSLTACAWGSRISVSGSRPNGI